MAKLNLSVDESVVARAKRYAASHGTSVSRLVQRYLDLLTRPQAAKESTPILSRMRGVLRGAAAGQHRYRRYLEEKYR